jgi:uncharacterized membrane protein YqjE
VFETLHKSKQISVIALDRVGDYVELLRLEMKLHGRNLGLRVLCYAVGAFFSVLAVVFAGVAIILTFWESDRLALAGWGVVVLYILVAAICIAVARKQTSEGSAFSTLRNELKRDVDLVKESI